MKTPKEYCEEFIYAVYDDAESLSKVQRKEVCQAFYAGIETYYKFIDSILDIEDDDLIAEKIVEFREKNKESALTLCEEH